MAGVESIKKNTTVGDAAVDGLLAGLGAGCVMLLYWGVAGLLNGVGWTAWLALFALNGALSPFTGGLTVLAIAAVYGVIFGVGVWLIPQAWRRTLRPWPVALGYTLLLLLLAESIFLPRMDSPVRAIPLFPMLLGHTVYGLALGWLINNTGALTHP
jgi:hypothetical protein